MQEYEYSRFDALVLLTSAMRLPLFAVFQGGDQTSSRLEAGVRPFTLPRARGLIVPSSRERLRLEATYTRLPPIATVPNPIDDRAWRAMPRAEARARLKLSDDLFIVLNHGRTDIHRKGLDTMLAAWKAFAGRHAERRLFIIGSGQDNAAFADLLAASGDARVTWHSRYTTDRAELRTWLSAADVYLTTSRVEGMPVAPLEAMALELPVVCTDAHGLPEIFDSGEASGGLMVARDDVPAIAAALTRLANDAALRCTLGRASRLRVESAFSLESVGSSLAAFLSTHGTC